MNSDLSPLIKNNMSTEKKKVKLRIKNFVKRNLQTIKGMKAVSYQLKSSIGLTDAFKRNRWGLSKSRFSYDNKKRQIMVKNQEKPV